MSTLTYINGVIASHDERYTHSEFLKERQSSFLSSFFLFLSLENIN